MKRIRDISNNLLKAFKNEEGLTFVELILVAAFAVFVIILAYQLLQFAQVGTKQVDANASVTGDTGVVLDILDRYLSQNTYFYTMDANNFTLKIPDKSGGADYIVNFSATDDGKLTMSRTRNGVTDQLVLSDNNANKASGIGFFQFYDDQGKLLGALDAAPSLTEVRAVKVTVVAKNPNPKAADGSDKYISSSRTVYFRNR